MNRIIRFTRVKELMLAVSAAVIVAGAVATVARGGFNLGIDFTGGVNKQFQIVPPALGVTYAGPGRATLRVAGGALTLQIDGVEQPRELRFEFRNYARIGDLVTALEFIDGVGAAAEGADGGRPSALLLPTNFPVELGERPAVVNRLLGTEEEVFAPIDKVRAALSGFDRFSLQSIGNTRDQQFVLKMPIPPGQEENNRFLQDVDDRIVTAMGGAFGASSVILKKTDFVGAVFSEDLVRGAFWSILVAMILILVYITVRFRFVYAAGAIMALIHDVAVMMGVIGAFQLEVTSATIAAVLTIIGYSLNDTIVVYDRIRENFSLMPEANRADVIDGSITQSLSRTTITSLTTLLAVAAIAIFGTGDIRNFSLNLIVGVVVGTYSSIFVAAPVVLGWLNAAERRRRLSRRRARGMS